MVKGALQSLKEERVIFAVSLLSFIFLCLEIYDVDDGFLNGWDDIFLELCFSSFLACLFTIPAAFLTKSLKNGLKYLIQICAAIIGGILGFFAKRGFGDKVYGELYYWGFSFALILITVYIFRPKDNDKCYFAGLIKHFFFSLLMATVFFAGLALLIFAFQNLIYDFDDWAEIYECTAAFSYLVFAVNVFVYYLFYRRDEESGKAFKVIFLYILFPVFFILILLLYAYLVKALVLWKLPNGQINWFVSFASCFYIVFYFVLREYDNLPVVRIFYKFGAFAFIPLICIQIPTYFIRLNAYGFTGWRFSSLLFIIFSIITIALTFIKNGKFTKYSILLLAGIILFASLSPFNLIKIAYKSQYGRMLKVLEKYDLFDKEKQCLKIYDRENFSKIISDEDRAQLTSSYHYMNYTSHIPMPKWTRDAEDTVLSFSKLFGIEEKSDDENIEYKSFSNNENTSINIENFVKMESFSYYESSYSYTDEKEEDFKGISRAVINVHDQLFDITDFLLSNPEKNNDSDYLYYNLDSEKVLCLSNYNYSWDKNHSAFTNFHVNGYIFWRKSDSLKK